MKPLIIIPARGGSKGVPGKNIKPLGGKPLINYTIEAARGVFQDELIYISTDSKEIIETVEATGLKVPFVRPAELSSDNAGTYDVLLHAISFAESNGYQPDTIVLLQPTSPFRTALNLKEALDVYTPDLDMVVSVKETHSNPYFLLFEENENGFLEKSKAGHYKRRQDCPAVWEYNGAIYIINYDSIMAGPLSGFTRVKKYVMDEFASVDIDTPLDWKLAELLILDKDER